MTQRMLIEKADGGLSKTELKDKLAAAFGALSGKSWEDSTEISSEMTLHAARKYAKVKALLINGGDLIALIDVTGKGKAIRHKVKKHGGKFCVTVFFETEAEKSGRNHRIWLE